MLFKNPAAHGRDSHNCAARPCGCAPLNVSEPKKPATPVLLPVFSELPKMVAPFPEKRMSPAVPLFIPGASKSGEPTPERSTPAVPVAETTVLTEVLVLVFVFVLSTHWSGSWQPFASVPVCATSENPSEQVVAVEGHDEEDAPQVPSNWLKVSHALVDNPAKGDPSPPMVGDTTIEQEPPAVPVIVST